MITWSEMKWAAGAMIVVAVGLASIGGNHSASNSGAPSQDEIASAAHMKVSVEIYRYGEDHEDAASKACFDYPSDPVMWSVDTNRKMHLSVYGKTRTESCDYDPATGKVIDD